jgi:hypothetical protein
LLIHASSNVLHILTVMPTVRKPSGASRSIQEWVCFVPVYVNKAYHNVHATSIHRLCLYTIFFLGCRKLYESTCMCFFSVIFVFLKYPIRILYVNKSLQYDKMNAPNYNIIRVCKMYKGYLRRYHTLQGDNSLKWVACFDHMMFVCRFQASRWSIPQREKLLCG